MSFTRDPRNTNPYAAYHSDPLLHLLLIPRLLRFPLVRESLLHLSIPAAFQHLRPASPNGALGYPNFRAHHSKTHRVFALKTGFGVEWSNLLGSERSWISSFKKVN
ncbi:hypothetical protein AVEN_116422-1 [Araneus ventricosus]|uniref:Uncharacterized protein n=1 Tax=Araneus ventricosus TaxID=182803 RepID=A0A4Y2KKG8_ARAVE|nr:hypothetical protein AVEN_116422-1 [Araneus ventricosus]